MDGGLDSHKLQVPDLSCNWREFLAWDTLHDITDDSRQQHWQGWNQFGTTGAFLSVPRYDWCTPLSYSSSCMLVNHWVSQQSWKEDYEPWKFGATARYHASHTRNTLPTKIQQAIGSHKDLLTIVKSTLKWYGHISCPSGLAKTILQSIQSILDTSKWL